MSGPLRVLELYCGIGGFAAAAGPAAQIVAAIDISEPALAVYRRNFSHPSFAGTLDSLPSSRLAAWQADLWWMSPPCQPFTRRGKRRDIDDPRASSFHRLVGQIAEVRPKHVAIENVPGFQGSRMHALLRETLERDGYGVEEGVLCPSRLGLPNRRERYYLVASREGLKPVAVAPVRRAPLASFLDPAPDRGLRLDPRVAARYPHALHIVDGEDPAAITACFTSAYGRSPVRSGSYLAIGDGGLRRFSPREILRLLGFPESYRLPPELPLRQAWRLVGNSLSLLPVRTMLTALDGFASGGW